jgi:hypothetical protein
MDVKLSVMVHLVQIILLLVVCGVTMATQPNFIIMFMDDVSIATVNV